MHFSYRLGEDSARIFLQVTVDIPSCGHDTFFAAPFSTAFTGWTALVRRNITWHKWGYISSQQLYHHLPVTPPLPTMFSFPLAGRPSPGTCCVVGIHQGLLIATMQLWAEQRSRSREPAVACSCMGQRRIPTWPENSHGGKRPGEDKRCNMQDALPKHVVEHMEIRGETWSVGGKAGVASLQGH